MSPILGYWKIKGLVQPTRLLLEYLEEKYEEHLYERDEGDKWRNKKFELGLEFPNLPYYIDGDVKLTQSMAIIRYIADKHNMLGGCPKERAEISMLEGAVLDIRYGVSRIAYSKDFETLKVDFLSKLPEMLKMFEDRLCHKTYLNGDHVTHPDFMLYDALDVVLYMDPMCLDAFPKLVCFKKRIEAIPQIDKYLKSSKYIAWPLQGWQATFGGGDHPPKSDLEVLFQGPLGSVNNPSFLGKMIGGTNSINILDLSQLAVNKVTGVIGYHFKPNAYGKLQVRINNRLLIDDYVSNNLFNYHYIGRQNKVDEVLCMGDSEHFTESDNRDVIIDSGGGLDRDRKDVVENCRKVIISPYTTVKGGKSNYTFYVKTAEYKGRGLYSEIDVDGTGTVVFPEFDLLSDCDQITYSKNSNTLSLRINFGQNNQFTLDIRNYVEQSSNKPHFVLIDKNGSNIVPKIERSDSSTIKISSFELHSEYSLGNFDDVETHYKKILNDDKDDKVLSVIRDKTQSQDNSVVPHMVFGSSGDDVINFDQGTMFARGGKGRDMYVIADSIGNKEVKIDNHSDDEKADTLFMPEVEKDFSIQQCDLHLKHNNSNIRVKNYLQDPNYRHLIVMNNKGEAFIPYVQSMSCSSSEKGKLVPFLQATQTQNMFLLPKDFQGDHIVIDSHLKDIEKYKDKDDLLLIREGEVPFIIRIEGFYNDQLERPHRD